MRNCLVTPAILFALFLSLAPAVKAGSIEQPPGHFGGFLSDGQIITVADDFDLAQGAAIQQIVWWGGYASPYLPTPDADDFVVRLYGDAGGKPGSLLATYHVGNANRVPTGDYVNPPDQNFGGRPEYAYSFDLPTPFASGTQVRYWMSVVNNPSSDSWVWEVSSNTVLLGVQRSFADPVTGPWQPYYDNTAFRLETANAANDEDNDGVPDDKDLCPGTRIPERVPMLGLGVNRFALADGDTKFDTRPAAGGVPIAALTTADTKGCSCEQILSRSGDSMTGLWKYGCTADVIQDFIASH